MTTTSKKPLDWNQTREDTKHSTKHSTQHVERQTGGQKKQLADNQLQKKVRMQTDEYHRM